MKEMIIVAIDASINYEEGLRVHLRAALRVGASQEEVFDAIESFLLEFIIITPDIQGGFRKNFAMEEHMLLERLGSFIAETQFSDLPPRVIDMAKVRLLDLLGAGLAGYRIGLYRPILEVLNVGVGKSTVWGEGILVSTRDASIINSFMAHSTYLEDGSRLTGGHPSSAVIPALLSLGETHCVSGDKVILGLVLGYEVFIRIGKAIYPSTVTRGFQPTAILASLGAAGGCAKILNLSREGCVHALAIGANLGCGLKSALNEPASQPIQVGRSCEGGLVEYHVGKPGSQWLSKDFGILH